ncbi:MAG: glycosyltransferase [Bdellovibrionales bacterium]|nr:glycosyltransferase [Bdellovibrionales bacterium]
MTDAGRIMAQNRSKLDLISDGPAVPVVSVLMPVYNCEKYVSEAIFSILSQTMVDFELVIINDGSSDCSKEKILSFRDPRIRYFENTVNVGLVKTLNDGIDLCRGRFIARMDADDISSLERLNAQVDFLDRNPSVSVVGSSYSVIGQDRTVVHPLTNDDITLGFLTIGCVIAHPSVMIRSNIFQNLELRYSEDDLHCEDFGLWTRLIGTYSFANLPSVLISYRSHLGQVSNIYKEAQDAHRSRIQLELFCKISKLGNRGFLNHVIADSYEGRATSFQLCALVFWILGRVLFKKTADAGRQSKLIYPVLRFLIQKNVVNQRRSFLKLIYQIIRLEKRILFSIRNSCKIPPKSVLVRLQGNISQQVDQVKLSVELSDQLKRPISFSARNIRGMDERLYQYLLSVGFEKTSGVVERWCSLKYGSSLKSHFCSTMFSYVCERLTDRIDIADFCPRKRITLISGIFDGPVGNFDPSTWIDTRGGDPEHSLLVFCNDELNPSYQLPANMEFASKGVDIVIFGNNVVDILSDIRGLGIGIQRVYSGSIALAGLVNRDRYSRIWCSSAEAFNIFEFINKFHLDSVGKVNINGL